MQGTQTSLKSIEHYLLQIGRENPFLPEDEERRKLVELKSSGEDWKDFAVKHNLLAMFSVCSKQLRFDRGEVCSLVVDALMRAAEDFDPEAQGPRFVKFAAPYVQETFHAAAREGASGNSYNDVRLDAQISPDSGEKSATFENMIHSEIDPIYFQGKTDSVVEGDVSHIKKLVRKIVDGIGGRPAAIFDYVFFENKTLTEAAERFHLDYDQVRVLVTRLLTRIRKTLGSDFDIGSIGDVR